VDGAARASSAMKKRSAPDRCYLAGPICGSLRSSLPSGATLRRSAVVCPSLPDRRHPPRLGSAVRRARSAKGYRSRRCDRWAQSPGIRGHAARGSRAYGPPLGAYAERARAADEIAQKTKQHLAVALDPLQQLRLAAFHTRSALVALSRQRSGNLWASRGPDKRRSGSIPLVVFLRIQFSIVIRLLCNKNSLFGSKIPLFRQVTNFTRNLLKQR
jgi:hypothetical protein